MATRLRIIGVPGAAYKPFPPRAPEVVEITPHWRIYHVAPDDRITDIETEDRTIPVKPTSRAE